MAELLFYREPTVLNTEVHRKLRFQPVNDFRFSAHVNSVPLLGVEFFEASRDLPIFFSKDEAGGFFPIALLSLSNSGHSQIDQHGKWIGSYTPAFIRRYPFALTAEKNVCFDEAYAGLSEESGEALFKEDGEKTDALDNIVAFLTNFEDEHLRTRQMCEALNEHDLLKSFTLQVMTADRQPVRLDGLYVIDEEKFGALGNELISDWFRQGTLGWVFAHLHSLGALKRLSNELNTRD